jgi:hypothetical protein
VGWRPPTLLPRLLHFYLPTLCIRTVDQRLEHFALTIILPSTLPTLPPTSSHRLPCSSVQRAMATEASSAQNAQERVAPTARTRAARHARTAKATESSDPSPLPLASAVVHYGSLKLDSGRWRRHQASLGMSSCDFRMRMHPHITPVPFALPQQHLKDSSTDTIRLHFTFKPATSPFTHAHPRDSGLITTPIPHALRPLGNQCDATRCTAEACHSITCMSLPSPN